MIGQYKGLLKMIYFDKYVYGVGQVELTIALVAHVFGSLKLTF